MNAAGNTQSRLRHIDNTLTMMRAAGYALDKDAIALVWKAASGMATSDEIEVWTVRMAESVADCPQDPTTHQRLDAIAATIANNMRHCTQQLESISLSLEKEEVGRA